MYSHDIYKTAKEIASDKATDKQMRYVTCGSCGESIKYDFANCKTTDPLDRVHPVFRDVLRQMMGDYRKH